MTLTSLVTGPHLAGLSRSCLPSPHTHQAHGQDGRPRPRKGEEEPLHSEDATGQGRAALTLLASRTFTPGHRYRLPRAYFPFQG